MIVGIDGKPFTSQTPGGLREYGEQLLRHVVEADRHNRYVVYVPKPTNLIPVADHVKTIVGPQGPWQVVLPRLIRQHPVDVIHFLHQHGSVFVRHPRVVTTVHDLADLRAFPPVWEDPYYAVLGVYIQMIRGLVIRHSRNLIAVSDYARREVSRRYPGRVCTVIPEGYDPAYHPPSGKLLRKHVLALSDFSPRKNTVRVLAAYAALPDSLRRRYPLSLVISMPHMQEKFSRLTRTYGIASETRFYVTPAKEVLAGLYRSAAVFLYPSLYEGFGLPLLEAMASGTPVVTSGYGAMREVAGDAAHLVDPVSVDSITGAMHRILTDAAYRDSLSHKGIKRSKRFSWSRAATETIKIYEQTYREA